MKANKVLDRLPDAVKSQLYIYSSMLSETKDHKNYEKLKEYVDRYIKALINTGTINKQEAKSLRLFYKIDLPKAIKGATK